jgi:serine protease AprX
LFSVGAAQSHASRRTPIEEFHLLKGFKVIRLFRRATIAHCIFPLLSFGGSPKIAPDLAGSDPHSVVNVVVQFFAPPDSTQLATIDQIGGVHQAELNLIHAGLYTIPSGALDALVNHPNVRYVSPDRRVEAMLDTAGPAVGAQMALTYGWDGTNVGVAIIDSGIQPEKDLLDKTAKLGNVSRVVYSQSFVPKVTSTSDQFGHGTHVAGIVAGNATSSTGPGYYRAFRGIAPNAKVINLRVLDSNGAGTDSAVVSAINTAIQLQSKYNIRVINLSLGRPVFESYTLDPLCQAVEKAWKAGIVVVVAAGNEGRNRSQGTDGYATITAPANDPLVITVGAIKTMATTSRADDLMASYSSKGPTLLDHIVKPDLVAPGNRTTSLLAFNSVLNTNSSSINRVLSSSYQNTISQKYSTDYYKLSGTSVAAPIVSGAAAVMLSRDSTLTPDTIKARLMKTATKSFPLYSTAVDMNNTVYTTQYDIFTIGAGYVDLWAAVNSPDTVPRGSTAASPTAVFNPATESAVLVNTFGAVWGTTATWSVEAVWSSTELTAAGTLWSGSAVWGSNSNPGQTIWGTAPIWPVSTPTPGSISILINGEN